MTRRRIISRIHAVLAALILGSCSGDMQFAGGGTGGTGISMGTVTGFGSVFVNGVEYDTEVAQVFVDGVSVGSGQAGQDALGLGMIVTVQGTINADGATGSAQTIEYKNRIVGGIESVVPFNNTFSVLRQSIVVTPSTIFADTSGTTVTGLVDLVENDIVAVSGFTNSTGEVMATRVERITSLPNEIVQLRGTVTDSDALNLHIGPLLVTFPQGIAPIIGDFVEVEGRYDPVTRILTATELQLGSEGITGDVGDQVEIEGVITEVGGGVVTVNGQKILTTPETELEGITLAGAMDRRVEVEGFISATGQIIAESIHAKEEGTLEITASVQSEDESAGTITMLQRTIRITPDTLIEDKAGFFANVVSEAEAETGFSPTFLSIDVVPGSSGEFIATKIELTDQILYELEGPIDADSVLGTGTFTIEGIPVAFIFQLPADITNGTVVQVTGAINTEGNGIDAEVVEREQ